MKLIGDPRYGDFEGKMEVYRIVGDGPDAMPATVPEELPVYQAKTAKKARPDTAPTAGGGQKNRVSVLENIGLMQAKRQNEKWLEEWNKRQAALAAIANGEEVPESYPGSPMGTKSVGIKSIFTLQRNFVQSVHQFF